jgi:hypothetical protein
MSDPTYNMISDFVAKLKNQLNKEKEEQEAREKDFHRHFQEREFEMEERESAWKRELERREVSCLRAVIWFYRRSWPGEECLLGMRFRSTHFLQI